MEQKEAEGKHLPGMSLDERLSDVVAEFNSSSGLQAKHKLDTDRMMAIGNIIGGTTKVLGLHWVAAIYHYLFWLVWFSQVCFSFL